MGGSNDFAATQRRWGDQLCTLWTYRDSWRPDFVETEGVMILDAGNFSDLRKG